MRGEPKYISQECKRRDHSACDGYVPRGYDEPHDHECSCPHHLPSAIAEQISRRFGRAIEGLGDEQKK